MAAAWRAASGRTGRLCALVMLTLAAGLWFPGGAAAQQATETPTAPEKAAAGVEAGRLYIARSTSPRTTLQSFPDLGADLQTALVDDRQTKDRSRVARMLFVADQWRSLIDLSDVPDATRGEVGAETAAVLMDVFARIAPRAMASVPDTAAVAANAETSFPVPNTPFRIIRIDSGPRQGEFLFSGATVQTAPVFFASIAHMPPRAPGQVQSWVSEFRQLTGPMVPASFVDAVPDRLLAPVLGTPIWKILDVLALTGLAALLLVLWSRLTTRPVWGGVAADRWRRLLGPLAADRWRRLLGPLAGDVTALGLGAFSASRSCWSASSRRPSMPWSPWPSAWRWPGPSGC